MEKYEQLSVVGEGSYGLVLKCRHRETEQVVAVKKFLETEEDAIVRRMALREIRMLKKLKHENLIPMIEVFRHRKRFYLVFEYLEGTVLDELEKMPNGLGDDRCRERIFQVTRAINYCHMNHVIHRDVKPENVLVSSLGVVKLCDFGFARLVSLGGEPCTEYVATRWYRAPELLVGEQIYGSSVDIWAIGCLYAEMMTGDPLFPGESDIDQLFLIVKLLGKPCSKHQILMAKNPQLRGLIRSSSGNAGDLYKAFPNWSLMALDFLGCCMKMDPQYRPTADELLRHNFFAHDRFPQRFLPVLREKVTAEFNANPLLRRYKAEVLMSTDKKEELARQQQQQRRSSQMDGVAPRWKFNLSEGSVKRKFSCDTSSGGDLLGGERSLSKGSTQRLSTNGGGQQQQQQKILGKQQSSLSVPRGSKQSMATPKNSHNDLPKSSEIQKLEKSLESLSKLSRPTSVQKEEEPQQQQQQQQHSSSSPLISQVQNSSAQQQENLIELFNKSSPISTISSSSILNVLHPSINNISFGKEPPKRSPNILQSLNNASLKHTFHQVPLLNPPRSHFLKKLDRNVTLDSMLVNVEPVCVQTNLTGSAWLNVLGNNNNNCNNGGGNKKKDQKVGRNDDFTLPELPGAISPNKPKKKSSPEDFSFTNTVTPDYRYSKAKRKYYVIAHHNRRKHRGDGQ